jgi:hypothetical protein
MLFNRRKERQFHQPWSGLTSFFQDPKSALFTAPTENERHRFFNTYTGWDWVAAQLRQELEQVSRLDLQNPSILQ